MVVVVNVGRGSTPLCMVGVGISRGGIATQSLLELARNLIVAFLHNNYVTNGKEHVASYLMNREVF